MAKAKFDIKSIEIPAVAAKPFYAGVGAADVAVVYVRGTATAISRDLGWSESAPVPGAKRRR